MLNLILFAACEKILTADDNVVSLISMMENLDVLVPQDTIPPDAIFPLVWFAYSYWSKDEKEDVEYDFRIDVVSPKGKVQVTSGERRINIIHPHHRVKFAVTGFPIGAAGWYKIKLFCKKPSENKWHQKAEYPVSVTYKDEAIKNEIKSEKPKPKKRRK